MAIYGKAIDKVVSVSSCRVAEGTKLLENIFCGVNIALVNELKLIYESVGKETPDPVDFCQTFVQQSAVNSDGNRRPRRIYLADRQFCRVNNSA